MHAEITDRAADLPIPDIVAAALKLVSVLVGFDEALPVSGGSPYALTIPKALTA